MRTLCSWLSAMSACCVMSGLASSRTLISMRLGLFVTRLASWPTTPASVAEKRSVCLSFGVREAVYGWLDLDKTNLGLGRLVHFLGLACFIYGLGISPKLAYDVEGRPFYVTHDGKGQPIMELFA